VGGGSMSITGGCSGTAAAVTASEHCNLSVNSCQRISGSNLSSKRQISRGFASPQQLEIQIQNRLQLSRLRQSFSALKIRISLVAGL
jgi:hypothetical protein